MSLRLALTRLGRLAVVLGLVSLASFGLLDLIPGDPAEAVLAAQGEPASPERLAAWRSALGLERPWAARYLAWLGRAVRLDLGRSWASGQPVAEALAERLPPTLRLAGAALGLTMAWTLALGLGAGLVTWPWLRSSLRLLTAGLLAWPNYLLGLLLIHLAAVWAGLVPVLGREDEPGLLLPALSLALAAGAFDGRVLASSLGQVRGQTFIRFALAKGLGAGRVLLGHLLPAALAPVLPLWGLTLGRLLGGAAVVESVFAYPGLGRLVVEAVLTRDGPLIQGAVLVMAVFFVAVNEAVDWLSRWLWPRFGREGWEHGGVE